MSMDEFSIEEYYHVPNQHSDAEAAHVRNEMLCNIANELHILNFLVSSLFKMSNEEAQQQMENAENTVVTAPAPTEG